MATSHPTVIDRLGLAQPLHEASQPSVFIVDDEPMVGEVVSVVLTMEGYHTRLFTSPTDALEAFESAVTKPDLLITDYRMMPLDGAALIARCREISPDFRSLLYSGNLTSDDVNKIAPTPDAFLSKPFLPKELIQTVKSVLNVRA